MSQRLVNYPNCTFKEKQNICCSLLRSRAWIGPTSRWLTTLFEDIYKFTTSTLQVTSLHSTFTAVQMTSLHITLTSTQDQARFVAFIKWRGSGSPKKFTLHYHSGHPLRPLFKCRNCTHLSQKYSSINTKWLNRSNNIHIR